MIIGGLQKFSLLDYPGNLAAIIFTEGCNFQCHFCYNPMLVLPEKARAKNKKGRSRLNEDDLFDFLKSRAGKLEAVVITGGEPTLHKDLPEFIDKIKDLRFKIKLDTNGTNPEMLKTLITPLVKGGKGGLIDYIAMDIKAPLDKYGEVVGLSLRGARRERRSNPSKTHLPRLLRYARNDSLADLSKIKKSIKIIIDSGLPYEFRTTVVPGLIKKEDIKKIGELIKGANKWYLQQFKPDTDLVNKKFQKVRPYSSKELEEMRKIGERYVKECGVR